MLSALSPTLPMSQSTPNGTDCAKRLLLRESLVRYRQEAQQDVFNTGRYRCRYVVWGRGRPLVLIPGMASDAQSLVMLMARLQAHFRCVSFDLPAGEDDGAHLMTYRHADLVLDLFALLDHLNIRDCVLVGFSFGSTIALAALHQQAWRFSHAILQGGLARRPLSVAEVFFASLGRFWPVVLGQVPLVRRIIEKNHREAFRGREPEVWDYFVERHCRVPLRAFAARVLMLRALDLRPILSAIHQPVLLVCGEGDPLVSKASALELKKGLQLAARAEIEQCGHYPQLTHSEVLAEVARQFLQPTCC
jgi:pimeloyl-ACP methyl ester carboxylesterase